MNTNNITIISNIINRLKYFKRFQTISKIFQYFCSINKQKTVDPIIMHT